MGNEGVSVSTLKIDAPWVSLEDCQKAGRIAADNYQENNMNIGYQTISWTCIPVSPNSGKIDYEWLRKLNAPTGDE
ncbi:MAG TPA: hypothetical protein PLS50_00335 [Candidatus Dojkabacteria bacterium]|nr:hypothetical protein [Candidatus Dojkabacteria bacterium]